MSGIGSFCRYCGSKVEPNSKFCSNCGRATPLPTSEKEAIKGAREGGEEGVSEARKVTTSSSSSPQYKKPERKDYYDDFTYEDEVRRFKKGLPPLGPNVRRYLPSESWPQPKPIKRTRIVRKRSASVIAKYRLSGVISVIGVLFAIWSAAEVLFGSGIVLNAQLILGIVFIIIGRIIGAAARSADRNEAVQWRAALTRRPQPRPQPKPQQQQPKTPVKTATTTPPPETEQREQMVEEKIKPSTGRKVVKGFGIAIVIFGAFIVLVGVVGEPFVLGALIFGVVLIIIGLLMIRVGRVRTIRRSTTTEGESERTAAKTEKHDEYR